MPVQTKLGKIVYKKLSTKLSTKNQYKIHRHIQIYTWFWNLCHEDGNWSWEKWYGHWHREKVDFPLSNLTIYKLFRISALSKCQKSQTTPEPLNFNRLALYFLCKGNLHIRSL